MGKDSQAAVAITPSQEGKKRACSIYIIIIKCIQSFVCFALPVLASAVSLSLSMHVCIFIYICM